jgi:hypothetical protein
MNKRKEAIRELHDRATECPGRVADGTCDGLCGWTAGLFAAYTAGRTKRDEVVQTLTDERIAHLEAALHVAVEQLEEVYQTMGWQSVRKTLDCIALLSGTSGGEE